MENWKLPAFAIGGGYMEQYKGNGLTKHEYACIKLGIPETGDAVIDDLIRKSERKRIASMAMQGILSNELIIKTGVEIHLKGERELSAHVTGMAIEYADALLTQLEKK